MTVRNRQVVIGIVGGGFTGGTLAYHLAAHPETKSARIVIFEPREKLGAGLAYDTLDPVHRINVPATRMSIDPAEPEHFAHWIERTGAVRADGAVVAADGQLFPRRQTFGDYVHAHLAPLVDSGRIEHRRERVVSIEMDGEEWLIKAEDRGAVAADIVVIATSHPSPSAPQALTSILEGNPRFVPDATVPNAISAIRTDDAVLIVGNGLTSADVIASLAENGHRGRITAISRRGLRSRGHAAAPQEPWGDFTSRPIRSARLLTRRIREAIREAGVFDVSWHAVIDAVRGQGHAIWQNLPVAERKKVVRHLRPFWDVHRFRIAPQIEQAAADLDARGQLETFAASVAVISYHNGRIRTALKLAKGRGSIVRDFDAVVVTTGPAHGGILQSQPFLERLAEDGFIKADPAALGIACDDQSRALDAGGNPVASLYIAGPLARGTFGELMGLPQVTEHAAAVAQQIAGQLASADSALRPDTDAA